MLRTWGGRCYIPSLSIAKKYFEKRALSALRAESESATLLPVKNMLIMEPTLLSWQSTPSLLAFADRPSAKSPLVSYSVSYTPGAFKTDMVSNLAVIASGFPERVPA